MKNILLITSMSVLSLIGLHGQARLGLVFSYAQGSASQENFLIGNEHDVLLYDLGFLGQEDVMSFGLSSKTELHSFFIKTDFLFRKTAYLFDLMNYGERMPIHQEFRNEYQLLHIPVSAGVSFKQLYFGAGPILNLVLDDSKNDALTSVFEVKERRRHFGFQFLIGFEIGRHLGVEVKYENVFSSVTDGYYYNGSRVNIKSSPNLFTMSSYVYF